MQKEKQSLFAQLDQVQRDNDAAHLTIAQKCEEVSSFKIRYGKYIGYILTFAVYTVIFTQKQSRCDLQNGCNDNIHIIPSLPNW